VQRSAAPTPAVTKTVVRYRSVTPAAAPTTAPSTAPTTAPTTAAGGPAPAAAPAAAPNVTDPWAVVAAYYGDIESGDYQNAWQLLDSGMTTGQTYQQFVDGFGCTGSQNLSENWESGDEVNFDLAATDDCSGAVQDFSGTDTVVNGKIVAADISADG
jgi:curli biogenesis system outer membrane secretion channel CsgG